MYSVSTVFHVNFDCVRNMVLDGKVNFIAFTSLVNSLNKFDLQSDDFLDLLQEDSDEDDDDLQHLYDLSS